MINSLSFEKARQVLRSRHFGRLGCCVNGEPYVIPINYKFEKDFIYCHSLPGMKIESLRKNPRTCLQVDEIASDLYWKSVLAFGNYEEVLDMKERESIRQNLLMEFPMLTPVESAVAEDVNAPEIIVFRIRVDRITGISEGVESNTRLFIEDASDGAFDAA